MFWSSWDSVIRAIGVGIPAYFALIFLLRISGKRTLSKFNAFDLIITVTFGSTLASALISKDVTLVDAVVAFALLVALQYVVTWSAVRWRLVSRMVKAEPRLLYRRGEFLRGAMKQERITKEEVETAMREAGMSSPELVAAVVMETDGTLSVITETADGNTAMPEGFERSSVL